MLTVRHFYGWPQNKIFPKMKTASLLAGFCESTEDKLKVTQKSILSNSLGFVLRLGLSAPRQYDLQTVAD